MSKLSFAHIILAHIARCAVVALATVRGGAARRGDIYYIVALSANQFSLVFNRYRVVIMIINGVRSLHFDMVIYICEQFF